MTPHPYMPGQGHRIYWCAICGRRDHDPIHQENEQEKR